MKISRDNYEAYFLDYYEGNLKGEEAEELFTFLDNNPDLAKEFNSFESITVDTNTKDEFSFKDKLRKETISTLNQTDFLIAYMEGDLNKREINDVEQFIQNNPKAEKELNQFKKTKLVPDKSIVYFGKSSLKKKEGSGRMPIELYRYVAIAASVVILIGTYFYFNNNRTDNNHQILSSNNSKPINGNDNIVKPSVQTPDTNNKLLASNNNIAYLGNVNSNVVPVVYFREGSINKIESKNAHINDNNEQDLNDITRAEENTDNKTVPVYIIVKKNNKDNKVDSKDNKLVASSGDKKKKGSRVFWDIASEGISKISGDKINFKPVYDKDDRMESYSFAAGPIKFNKNLDNR
jgi:hypothetical protein